MRLLADQGVDKIIVDGLRTAGHDVSYVAEFDPGMLDNEVLALANQRRALIITADKDFGELVYRLARIHTGVARIRLPGLEPESKAAVVVDAIKDFGAEMAQAFSVITTHAVRIRRKTDS